MRSTERLALVLGAVGLAATGVLLWMPTPVKDTFSMEIAKALIQLVFVSVAGTTASVLVFEYQRARQSEDQAVERRRNREEVRLALIRELLERSMASYIETKRARRLMRARGLDADANLPLARIGPYDALMEAISDVQLGIESVSRDLDTAGVLLHEQLFLKGGLDRMASYLSALITEFERGRVRFHQVDP
jgi:hypothetical protein